MTVDPTATALEKEQAEMKSVIKEQMQEINDLAAENEQLKEALKHRESVAQGVPDFLQAQHIELNTDALKEELKEGDEQIEELRKAVAEKQAEIQAIQDGADEPKIDESGLDGLDPQQRAEEMEKRARAVMVERMQNVATLEQEKKSYEKELAQLMEIQKKLQARDRRDHGIRGVCGGVWLVYRCVHAPDGADPPPTHTHSPRLRTSSRSPRAARRRRTARRRRRRSARWRRWRRRLRSSSSRWRSARRTRGCSRRSRISSARRWRSGWPSARRSCARRRSRSMR